MASPTGWRSGALRGNDGRQSRPARRSVVRCRRVLLGKSAVPGRHSLRVRDDRDGWVARHERVGGAFANAGARRHVLDRVHGRRWLLPTPHRAPAAPVLRRTDPVAQREARLCDDAGGHVPRRPPLAQRSLRRHPLRDRRMARARHLLPRPDLVAAGEREATVRSPTRGVHTFRGAPAQAHTDAETMRAALTVALLMLGASSRSDAIDYVALCQSSVQGTKIWLSSTIDVYRKDLSAKLNDVDIPPYCECFHRRLREGLGDDLYERSRSFADPLSPAELRQTSEEDRKAVIACVETQVGDRNTPSGPQTGTRIAHQDEYLRFVRSTVTPGSGIGGLRLGDSKAAMFDVLGPTKTFKPLPDGGEQYYYGPNVIEVIISISPSPARAVRGIELSSPVPGPDARGRSDGRPAGQDQENVSREVGRRSARLRGLLRWDDIPLPGWAAGFHPLGRPGLGRLQERSPHSLFQVGPSPAALTGGPAYTLLEPERNRLLIATDSASLGSGAIPSDHTGARWFDSSGQPLTAWFDLGFGQPASLWPLIGGGVAIQHFNGWVASIASGSPLFSAPPPGFRGWLTAAVLGGKAYARVSTGTVDVIHPSSSADEFPTCPGTSFSSKGSES